MPEILSVLDEIKYAESELKKLKNNKSKEDEPNQDEKTKQKKKKKKKKNKKRYKLKNKESDKKILKVQVKKCIACLQESLFQDTQAGTFTCTNCGCLNENIVDSNPDWKFSDNKNVNPSRCGGPVNPLLPKLSMATKITGSGGWSVKKVHTWNLPYRERSLLKVFNIIQNTCQNHNISACISEYAKELYKSVSDVRISRGDIRNGLIASCVFYACKIHNVSRNPREIAQIFNVNARDITRGCKRFMDVKKKQQDMDCIKKFHTSKTENFIPRFCSSLNIMHLEKTLNVLCKKAEKLSVVSRNAPSSIVAGVIYLVSDHFELGITKKDISEKCNISQVTISKCFHKMNENKIFLLENITDENLFKKKELYSIKNKNV